MLELSAPSSSPRTARPLIALVLLGLGAPMSARAQIAVGVNTDNTLEAPSWARKSRWRSGVRPNSDAAMLDVRRTTPHESVITR